MSAISIILKVVDFCNFSCSFCRYTLQTNLTPKQMPISLAKETLIKGALYNIKQGKNYIHIIFHGGEPLLWGISNFKEILMFQDDFKSAHLGFEFYNSIQTNASLLTAEFVDLFQKYNFSIGISVDGPEECNFHQFPKSMQQETLQNKLALLSPYNCNYGVLSVITNSHKGKAKAYYDFLVNNGIRNVGLCFCFDPIGNSSVKNDILSEFLIDLFDLYFYGSYKCRIREFDEIIKKCLGKESCQCNLQNRAKCGRYFSAFPNGEVQFCDAYEYKSMPLGDITLSTFSDIVESPALIQISATLQKNYNDKCSHCPVVNLCCGGCFRNDMQDGTNYFCQTYKVVYPYIYHTVEKFRKEVN